MKTNRKSSSNVLWTRFEQSKAPKADRKTVTEHGCAPQLSAAQQPYS